MTWKRILSAFVIASAILLFAEIAQAEEGIFEVVSSVPDSLSFSRGVCVTEVSKQGDYYYVSYVRKPKCSSESNRSLVYDRWNRAMVIRYQNNGQTGYLVERIDQRPEIIAADEIQQTITTVEERQVSRENKREAREWAIRVCRARVQNYNDKVRACRQRNYALRNIISALGDDNGGYETRKDRAEYDLAEFAANQMLCGEEKSVYYCEVNPDFNPQSPDFF